MSSTKRGLLERLEKGIVVGDGGFVFAMEKRGYAKAGWWTPEVSVEHPDALRELHREFLRAGSDVMQAYTFYASDDKLECWGNKALEQYTGATINAAACRVAREVAEEGNALVAGGLSQTPSYLSGMSKAEVQSEFRKQVDVFVQNNVDFLICEYFEHIEEMEWAIEVCKETNLAVCASMCIGPVSDNHGVATGQCAVRMARAGADVVGLNCHFGPDENYKAMVAMKAGLDKAGLHPYLMSQPVVYQTPDASVAGFIDLPEFPFALEPRISTRWEIQKWARKMHDLGVRYIGGCCGFEPYHIRAISEELRAERGFLPKSSEKHDLWGAGLKQHTKPWVRARGHESYWRNLLPASGRPFSASLSVPDQWGVTQGDAALVQSKDILTDEDLKRLVDKSIHKCGHSEDSEPKKSL